MPEYQLLHAFCVLLAMAGAWFSAACLCDAWQDRMWLRHNGYNGTRLILATAMVLHEAGRLTMQLLLVTLSGYGVWFEKSEGPVETTIEVAIVLMVASISWHSRHARIQLRRWRKDHPDGVQRARRASDPHRRLDDAL